MRRWQDLAAPDDPDSWYAVTNMLPTVRGTYETARGSTGLDYSAAGADAVRYAFAARTLTGSREYVVTSNIWEFSGSALTDRTNGVTIGTQNHIMMAQYGDVTIAVMGVGNPTVKSTGGNFSDLSGAPKGEIVCVQSNAILIFNTDTGADGWAASDVGDYTNWTTGEAASGRIIATPGPVTAAVPFGNDVFVFKPFSIYRMTYVGGTVKWQVQLVWKGSGIEIPIDIVASTGKFLAVATQHGIAYCANDGGLSNTQTVFLFDGSSQPRRLNPLTTISILSGYAVYLYNPKDDMLVIAPMHGSSATGTSGASASVYHYYNFSSDCWGASCGGSGEVDGSGAGDGNGVLQGEWQASSSISSSPYSKPVYWAYRGVSNTLTRNSPSTAASCSLQTQKVGATDRNTTFNRLTPLLRRRTDLGTDSASLSFELFREREDTSAQSTRTVTESTNRKRFDLLGGANTDVYGRFKVTWTALDVEVDDFAVASTDAGSN